MADKYKVLIANDENSSTDAARIKYKDMGDGTFAEVVYFAGGGGGVAATWDNIEGKPEFIAAGDTQAQARAAIGAGTGNSNLVIGTTASTAMAGNTVIPAAPAPERLVPVVGTENQVLKVVSGVPAWAADTNTTYTAMTAALATAGTATAANTISPLVLAGAIDERLPTPGTAVADAVDETDVVAQFNALLASLRVAGVIASL